MKVLAFLTLAPLALVPVYAWTNTTSTVVSTYTPPSGNSATSSTKALNYSSTTGSRTGPSPSTSPTTVSNVGGKISEGLGIVALAALGGLAGLL